MSGIGKLFVVLNLVFSLVIVGAAAAYLSKADEWKTKYNDLQNQYTTEKESLEEEISNLRTRNGQISDDRDQKQNTIDDLELEKSRLEQERQTLEVNNQQLRDDVTKINSTLDDFQTNMNELQARNNELVDQNAQLRTDALDAADKQRKAEQDLVRVEGDLNTAREQIESLEERVTKLEDENTHLSNILAVANQQGFDINSIVAMPEISAYIEEVNNELGFVILSVGSDDNVKKGYTFSIYRGNSYLGEVQVDDVYPDRSAARIKFRVDGAQFQVNDKATTLL